jgi:hypothetical protein
VKRAGLPATRFAAIMPPIKRTKALFFPNFHIREDARNLIFGAVRRARLKT